MTKAIASPLNFYFMPHSFYLKSIFFLFLYSLNSHAADRDDPLLHSATSYSVHLDEAIIDTTGIKTQKLQTTLFNPEIETFAIRVDLSSLIDSRKDYFMALAKLSIANIKYKKAQQDLQRLENLLHDKAVSTRKFLTQKNQSKIDKANLLAAEQQAEVIRLHTRSKWGNTLSHWFLSEEYPYANMLNTLNKSLYLVYLPTSIQPSLSTIAIHPFGLRDKAHTASLISSAVFYNSQQTGTPFFYLSDQAIGTYHQRVVVWLPLQKEKKTGFIIPQSAIVWHLGQAYVYLQVADELFNRVKITQKKLLSSKSYFIQQPLQEGDTLVITGTQMLLAEEFRGQIPAEDDDDNN